MHANEIVRTNNDMVSRYLLNGMFNTDIYDEEEATFKTNL
jgi:hypothetical protein